MGDVTSIVQSGETLSLYAKMYNCSEEELRMLNGISNGNNIKAGIKIKIPIGEKPTALAKSENKMQQNSMLLTKD